MEMGHGSFIAWSFTDGLAMFNEHLRWPGWRNDVRPLPGDQGIAVYPFPFTAEGSNLAQVSRRPAPIAELVALWDDLARQVRRKPKTPR